MAEPPEHDIGASTYQWCEVIRRARLERTTKYVALLIASYANPDGTKVFPGVARLTVEAPLDYRAVRRALARLRGLGLLEVVARGNRRRGQSDEYRLTIPPDLLDKLDIPSVDKHAEDIEYVRAGNRNHRVRAPRERVITGSGKSLLQGPHTPPPDHEYQAIEKDHPSIPIADAIGTVSRPSARAADAAAMDGSTNGDQVTSKRWADIQQRHDNEEITDFDVIDLIGLAVGWELDTIEQRTVAAMLAGGSHVKAITNKIAKDRSAA